MSALGLLGGLAPGSPLAHHNDLGDSIILKITPLGRTLPIDAPPRPLKAAMVSEAMLAWALAWLLRCKENITQAARHFRDDPPGRLPQRVHDYLRGVWRRYQRREITLAAQSTPQRAKKISDKEAKEAAVAFGEGFQGVEGNRRFDSAEEVSASSPPPRRLTSTLTPRLPLQACQRHPLFKRLTAEHDVSPKHLWKRAKEVDPQLASPPHIRGQALLTGQRGAGEDSKGAAASA